MQALTVLEFLIKRGSSQCVELAQQEIAPRLAQLQQFSYVAPDGKDQGVNVTHRYRKPYSMPYHMPESLLLASCHASLHHHH